MNKKTFGNHVLIRLDAENDSIKLNNGGELYIDTSYDGEKHVTVSGEVVGLPSHLRYTGVANDGLPWLTPMETQIGDKVIVYYLAVVNAFKKENHKYFIENGERYVFITYQNIYCLIRGEKIIPCNGYCLIEPHDNPELIRNEDRMKKLGLEPVVFTKPSNIDVVYGKVRYVGIPNEEYVDEGASDKGVNIAEGDIVVMRRVTDVLIQYSLHAKIDGGKPYFRVQRRHILAKT